MDIHIPAELRYTKEHEWILDEGEVATVGVTDYAQNRLGDVVFVEMPEPGTAFKKGDSLGVVESIKAVSDIFAPVGGEVLEINVALEEHPEYVNGSPYGDGWIVKIRMSKKTQTETESGSSSELEQLMNAEQYGRFVQQAMEKE
jgi:glycine cleavage system H protein